MEPASTSARRTSKDVHLYRHAHPVRCFSCEERRLFLVEGSASGNFLISESEQDQRALAKSDRTLTGGPADLTAGARDRRWRTRPVPRPARGRRPASPP